MQSLCNALKSWLLRQHALGEPRLAVEVGHEDVGQAAVLQIGQAGEPELGPFVLAQPEAQEFLAAL